MQNNIFDLEKEFLTKLSDLQSEFDNKVIDLKKEFTQKVNSFLLNKDGVEIKKPEYIPIPIPEIIELFILNDSELLEKLKIEYQKRYHFSYNVLCENYLDCFKQEKRKGCVRWLRQLIVHYPDKVNLFLNQYKDDLISDYDKILYDFGFIKK